MAEQPLDPRRAIAVKRVEEKHALRMHAVVFVAVNTMLVVIWLFTGNGFFWPIIPIALWGMGLLIHAYTAYFGDFYTESEIEKELAKLPKDATPPRPGK